MKKLLIVCAILCIAGFAFGDASDLSNAFNEFGDCEGILFQIPSARSNWPTMAAGDGQANVAGVVGNCHQTTAPTGRFEGGSAVVDVGFYLNGTDSELSFYYKIPTMAYSYPQLAVCQNRSDPQTNGEMGDCAAYKSWTNADFTIDTSWHQLTATLDTLDWAADDTASFYTNNYAVPEWYVDEIILTDPTPLDASDDADNAFAAFGDCEGDIFITASGRANWTSAQLPDQQTTCTGVIGLGCEVLTPSGRLEGGSAVADVDFNSTDVVFQMFYKMPTLAYSYPRLAVRQDPADPQTNGEVQDCAAYIEWQNSSFTIDGAWHKFTPDISTLNWDGVLKANFYTNNYAVPTFSLDEISLVDPNPPVSGVEDWGLISH